MRHVFKCGAYALFIFAIVFYCAIARRAFHDSRDFIPIYTGASCFFFGCNPYNTHDLEGQYFSGQGARDELPSWDNEVPVYPPSTFAVLFPFGLLNYSSARFVWLLLNGCLLLTAVILVILYCDKSQRSLALVIGALFLGTSPFYLVVGQPTVFSVSLLAIGVVLFFQGRLLPLAAILLALSLAVKPQLGGLIVLYLIYRRIRRRYALAASGLAVLALLVGMFILSHRLSSAHWMTNLRANAAASLERGHANDPSPANFESLRLVNLQSITSVFIDDQETSNRVTYLIVGIFFVLWCVAVFRSDPGWLADNLGIAALCLLTLFPIYHRSYDTRLLVLCLPVVVLLSKDRSVMGSAIACAFILSLVSFQNQIFQFLNKHSRNVLDNKFLYFVLLREQVIMMCVLFLLLVAALWTLPRKAQLA